MYLSPLDTRATLWSCPSRETIDISSSYDTYEPHRLRAHGEAIVNVIPWQLKLPLMQDCMRIRSLCMSNTKEVITMWNLNRTKKCSEEWSAWNFMKCVPMEISLFYVSVLVSRLKNNFKKSKTTTKEQNRKTSVRGWIMRECACKSINKQTRLYIRKISGFWTRKCISKLYFVQVSHTHFSPDLQK